MQRGERTNTVINQYLFQNYRQLLEQDLRKDAARLASQMLVIDDSAESWYQLAFNGMLTGRPVPENLEQARICYRMTGGRDALVINLLAELLGHFGQSEEGIGLIEGVLPVCDPDERILLEARRRHLSLSVGRSNAA